jgi:lysozyme
MSENTRTAIMQPSEKCMAVIKHSESLHDGDLTQIGLQPKPCPAGIWTVGWGHALKDPKTGRFLRGEKDKAKAYALYPALTEEEAEAMLAEDLEVYAPNVTAILERHDINCPEQWQFDALVSFAYNCGLGALEKNGRPMSVLRDIKNGNPEAIKKAFGLWIKSEGKVMRGLVFRRKTEAHLYLTGEVVFYN